MSDATPEDAGADACLRCGAKTILMADDDICLPCYDLFLNNPLAQLLGAGADQSGKHRVMLTPDEMADAGTAFERAATDETLPAETRATLARLAARWPVGAA